MSLSSGLLSNSFLFLSIRPRIFGISSSAEKLSHVGSRYLRLIIKALKLTSLYPFLAKMYMFSGLKKLFNPSKFLRKILATIVDFPVPELP